uniref:Chymotrypsin-like elastase family member 2B n=1 Tax=Schistocephalus solidus TaxID=70667 RepID=A0A0V0J0Y3_SCHSO
MNIFIAAEVYCIALTIIVKAVEIELGFPTACGVPAVQREYKEPAERMKVPATPYSWPWNVGIWSKLMGNFPYCGGALISNSLVLTAAHCLKLHFGCATIPVGIAFELAGVTPYKLQILLGSHDFTIRAKHEQAYIVQLAIVHPNFNQDALLEGTDLAILKINGQVTKGTIT